MEISTLTTRDRSLLEGVRAVIAGADSALLCVAFAHPRGVHLIADELRKLSRRGEARLVATTTFDQTGGAALAIAAETGVRVRTLNPGGGTYHPKVYLGSARKTLHALVGSANLTGGLVSNVEVGMLLRGPSSEPALSRLNDWAEDTWARAQVWNPGASEVLGDDLLDPALLSAIEAERRRDPVFMTLGSSQPNRVVEVTPSEVLVETRRSRSHTGGAASIPAWMFNVAWDYLRAHRELSNSVLLNHLRVHRSSAVCAILARVPGIARSPGRAVGLRLAPATHGRR